MCFLIQILITAFTITINIDLSLILLFFLFNFILLIFDINFINNLTILFQKFSLRFLFLIIKYFLLIYSFILETYYFLPSAILTRLSIIIDGKHGLFLTVIPFLTFSDFELLLKRSLELSLTIDLLRQSSRSSFPFLVIILPIFISDG